MMIPIYAAIIAFFGGALCSFLVQSLIALIKRNKHRRRILTYMNTKIPSEYNFVTTKNIASNTNLPKARVVEICSYYEPIQESTGDRDDRWGLRGISQKTTE